MEKEVLRDVVLVILSLIIVALLVFIFFDLNDEEEKEEELKSEVDSTLSILSELTIENCIALAQKSEDDYNTCVELGTTTLRGEGNEIDCNTEYDSDQTFCRDIMKHCRSGFNRYSVVFPRCLSYSLSGGFKIFSDDIY